jgi:hypothetical protein
MCEINKSFKFYQGTGYGPINQFLREPDFKESLLRIENIKHKPEIEHIINMDKGLTYNVFGERYFYRGMANGFIPASIIMSSGVIINKGFTSCTKREDVTKSYTDEEGCCMLKFIIPDNIKSYVYEYEGKYNEAEVLLQRNTQFTIVSKYHPVYYAVLSLYTPPDNITKELTKTLVDYKNERMAQMAEEDIDWDS